MSFREAIPQTDEEEQVELPTTKTWPWSRAVLAVLVAGLFMALIFAGMNFKGSKGTKDYEFDAHALQALDEFKIPEIPANPIQVAKEKALEPLNEFRDKYGINVLRKDEIALCVTNLNLGLWKLVQLGAILAETQVNCPAGFTNIDKKIACNINIAAVVAATSAATSFFASSAFLCTGRANPDAECTTILAATFEQLATFPASENQIALFCPKNSYEETIVRGGVPVYAAAARLRRLNDPNASQDSRGLQDVAAQGLPDLPEGPSDPVELVFCTWEIAQTLWFIARAGPLIEIATKRCPADKSSHAGCSEVINEILTMFFNAAKFIAAATTNCIDGMNVAAGCSLGTLNFVSAITGTGSVISALADGVCSDLGPRRKAATEERVNRKINKINLVRSKTLRRLLREKKISGGAVAEASKLIAEAEKSPTTVQKFFPGLQTDRAHLHALALSHLRSLKSSPLTEAERLEMMAKVHELGSRFSNTTSVEFLTLH